MEQDAIMRSHENHQKIDGVSESHQIASSAFGSILLVEQTCQKFSPAHAVSGSAISTHGMQSWECDAFRQSAKICQVFFVSQGPTDAGSLRTCTRCRFGTEDDYRFIPFSLPIFGQILIKIIYKEVQLCQLSA